MTICVLCGTSGPCGSNDGRAAVENHERLRVAADSGGSGYWRARARQGSGRDGAGGVARRVGVRADADPVRGGGRRALGGTRAVPAPTASTEARARKLSGSPGIGIEDGRCTRPRRPIGSAGARRRNGAVGRYGTFVVPR